MKERLLIDCGINILGVTRKELLKSRTNAYLANRRIKHASNACGGSEKMNLNFGLGWEVKAIL